MYILAAFVELGQASFAVGVNVYDDLVDCTLHWDDCETERDTAGNMV